MRSAVAVVLVAAVSVGAAALWTRPSADVAVRVDISPAAFGEALRSGDLEAVDELLTNGADPDLSDGRTPPVVVAVVRDDIELLQRLIDGGADVESTDATGVRALHRAARAASVPLIEVLLAAGADVSALDPLGRSALSFALEANDIATVDRLLEAGANPNQQDINGRTSVYWAVSALVDLEILDALVEAGGDPDAGSPSARDAASDNPTYLDRLD